MIDGLGDPTIDALRVALGRTARRAAVTASNLANLETPGYRALEIRFESPVGFGGGFESARTHPGHLAPDRDASVRGRIHEAPITRIRNDGNTVDLDQEMTRVAKVRGRYHAAAEMVRKRFALLAYAASDGGNSA